MISISVCSLIFVLEVWINLQINEKYISCNKIIFLHSAYLVLPPPLIYRRIETVNYSAVCKIIWIIVLSADNILGRFKYSIHAFDHSPSLLVGLLIIDYSRHWTQENNDFWPVRWLVFDIYELIITPWVLTETLQKTGSEMMPLL